MYDFALLLTAALAFPFPPSEAERLLQQMDGKFLRGRIASSRQLEFGIEAYYLQEGRGAEYEKAVRDRRLSAEIAVTADGQAVLRGLRIE